MNPMTNVKNIQKLNDKVLQMGVEDAASWHKQYKDSAYVFLGGLPYDLTEGDILCVFSQYGEIVDINLVRDKSSGKFKGYGFLCYEDQRSTILAVDNLNSIKLGGRTIRVDHVANYKRPKGDERDEKGERQELPLVGCAPTTPPGSDAEEEKDVVQEPKKKKKKKKEKSKKRAKESKRNEQDEGKERKRRLSPNLESKISKISEVGKEDRKRRLENTSDMDRRERDKLNEYGRSDQRKRYVETDRDEDKYKGNIEERNRTKDRREYSKGNERSQDRDTERKRYLDRK